MNIFSTFQIYHCLVSAITNLQPGRPFLCTQGCYAVSQVLGCLTMGGHSPPPLIFKALSGLVFVTHLHLLSFLCYASLFISFFVMTFSTVSGYTLRNWSMSFPMFSPPHFCSFLGNFLAIHQNPVQTSIPIFLLSSMSLFIFSNYDV